MRFAEVTNGWGKKEVPGLNGTEPWHIPILKTRERIAGEEKERKFMCSDGWLANDGTNAINSTDLFRVIQLFNHFSIYKAFIKTTWYRIIKVSIDNKVFQEKLRVVLCAPIKKILNEIDTVQSKRLSDYGDKGITITESTTKIQVFEETCGFCSLVIKFSESELLFENAYSLRCLTAR